MVPSLVIIGVPRLNRGKCTMVKQLSLHSLQLSHCESQLNLGLMLHVVSLHPFVVARAAEVNPLLEVCGGPDRQRSDRAPNSQNRPLAPRLLLPERAAAICACVQQGAGARRQCTTAFNLFFPLLCCQCQVSMAWCGVVDVGRWPHQKLVLKSEMSTVFNLQLNIF